jgi:hypothetical protein
MRCDEMEEFVSAMYDGAAVPQEAAEHAAHCAACQELFQSFVEMGAELRRFGSLQSTEPVPERTWVQREQNITGWWQKGWQTMKVPRVAFASLIVLLLVVGSRLALVEARAHENGNVLLLTMSLKNGLYFSCPLSVTDPRYQQCSGSNGVADGSVSYLVHILKKDGDRALLSLRSQVSPEPLTPAEMQAGNMPETQLWLSTDKATDTTLGSLAATLTAQWIDHIPVMMGNSEVQDPSANELRLTYPLLLENNHVVGDIPGAMAFANHPNQAVFLYVPGEGRFAMSLTPFADAVPGKIKMNRISFTSDGHSYVIVTGAPVARGEVVWVKRDTSYKPPSNMQDAAFVGTDRVSHL